MAIAAGLLTQPTLSFAVNPDTCIEQGGPAECTGPEVGPYAYSLFAPGWSAGPFGSEDSALALLQSNIQAGLQTCTISIHNPPWYPLPPASGSYTVGTDSYSVSVSSFGMEHNQRKWSVTASGTDATNSTPPCGYNYSFTYQLYRWHAIACPTGYQANMWTPGPNGFGYCWRTAPWQKPEKNFGRPQQCDLSMVNPLNVALTQHVDTGGATTGWTVTTENDVREEYDSAGSLISQSNRGGITHSVIYDAAGRITSVVHSLGYQIVFNYDVNNRLTSISPPGGGAVVPRAAVGRC